MGADSGARSGAHDRQPGRRWRRLKELQGGRPPAEQAFHESGPARKLARQIIETGESLALLLGTIACAASSADKIWRAGIGDRPALCQISGISRDSFLMWLEKQEANHA